MRFSSTISLIPTLALFFLTTKVAKVTALPSPLLDLVDDAIPPLPAVGGIELPSLPKGFRLSRRKSLAPRESPQANPRGTRRIRRSALDFAQPARIPMPLLKPREVDTTKGEVDEDLENRKKCSEANMHDCYVSHEGERVKERRAEAAALLGDLLDNVPVANGLLKGKGARMLVRRR